MIKMVVSDLDGTILQNGAQRIPENIFPLIRQLKELGILFVAASGRQYVNMRELFDETADDMAFVCENGAMAVQNEEIIYQDVFPKKLAVEILKAIHEKEGAEFTCSTKDFFYMRPKTEHFRNLMLNVVRNSCKEINSFDEVCEPVMKLAVYEKTGVTDESLRYWMETFGKDCVVVTSGNAWIDFIPFGTNKAKGIRKFMEKYGISRDECMAFGDEYNDIEMLKEVKYSFAMNNARDGVRAVAAYTTEHVQTVLERLIQAGGEIKEVL